MAKATSTEEKNKGKAGVKSAKPVRKGEGGTSTDGLHRALKVSPELEAVIGVKEVARADAVSKIWAYIRENNLQNPEDKREILPDEKLKKVFDGRDKVTMFEMNKHLSNHLNKE
ncbi:MAG TPA: SWIB/MDM2 domain-containing protein [Lautropia sp.]|jgi:chromatin remodeling complex protein RSC6|nr:SWIB/MDM2 domain-containing protein [Lautropia sp.]